MSDPGDLHPLWLGLQPLLLASGSQTRFAMLAAAGIPVEARKPEVDERAVSGPLEKAGEPAEHIALHLAKAKALAVLQLYPSRTVLGADQTLACAGAVLHKPHDRKAAAKQLAFLSGRTHHLHSAVALAAGGRIAMTCSATAALTMRTLSPAMIECYLDAAGEGAMQSVGGYQLERAGIHLFEHIEGAHETILGLPMLETLACLRSMQLVLE